MEYINLKLAKKIMYLSAKGFNKTVVGEKLNIHRVTVQRYHKEFRKMSDKTFAGLINSLDN